MLTCRSGLTADKEAVPEAPTTTPVYQLTTNPSISEGKEESFRLAQEGRSKKKRKPQKKNAGLRPERFMIGGLLETPSALRMVGLVKNLPLNLIETEETLVNNWRKRPIKRKPCFMDYDDLNLDKSGIPDQSLEDLKNRRQRLCLEGKRIGKSKVLSRADRSSDDVTEAANSGTHGGVEETEETEETEEKETAVTQTVDYRNSKRSTKARQRSSTPPSAEVKATTVSCCKPHKGIADEMSDSAMRRETARMNLDVLRRLATMLGEEREKFAAEREMLGASRDMMQAETRKVNSERSKIEAERQKVDLERDVLQSQMLGRRT